MHRLDHVVEGLRDKAGDVFGRIEIALGVGEPAYLGVRATPGPQIIIGPECVPGKKEND